MSEPITPAGRMSNMKTAFIGSSDGRRGEGNIREGQCEHCRYHAGNQSRQNTVARELDSRYSRRRRSEIQRAERQRSYKSCRGLRLKRQSRRKSGAEQRTPLAIRTEQEDMTREILFHALAFSFKIYPESDFLLTEPESPFACLFTALYFAMT